ncbi:MAG TPA: ABC transporter permease subunit [Gemmatimonadaceae bacterium]|jgi:Cu-processing system permease protein
MNTVVKVLKYQARDAIRSRWLIAYALFFLVVTDALLRFSGDPVKAQLSLVSIVLFVVPLIAIVFGTVYLYNAREFIELILAQPVDRRQTYCGLYLGLTLPLIVAFAVGLSAPFLLNGLDAAAWGRLAALIVAGTVLTCVFTGIATSIAVKCEDRLRGLGAAIGVWLLVTIVYDGLVLLVLAVLADFPLERATLGLMMANPIDIARVGLLLRFDGAAMMGYTGAVFLTFFSGATGMIVATLALAAWIIAPIAFGVRVFQRKDF